MTYPASLFLDVPMERVIVHWTAGSSQPTEDDRAHYHALVTGDGRIVPGVPSIAANSGGSKRGYAAHTRACNSGSIGVSLCGMRGAVESPFHPGPDPITEAQWLAALDLIAALAKHYKIAVTPKTILTHAEVQANLNIRQRGKWDIARLPWNPGVVGAKAVGDLMRAGIIGLSGGKLPTDRKPAADAPDQIPDTTWPTLRQGDKGQAVMDLQYRLRRRGSDITADGVFGFVTKATVQRFQRLAGLTDDGIVGPATWAALD